MFSNTEKYQNHLWNSKKYMFSGLGGLNLQGLKQDFFFKGFCVCLFGLLFCFVFFI